MAAAVEGAMVVEEVVAGEGEGEVSGNLGSVVIVCELQATPLTHV